MRVNAADKTKNFCFGQFGRLGDTKNINVALGEFPPAAFLGFFGPPNGLDLPTAEGEVDFGGVLGKVAGGGEGEIIDKADLTVATVFEGIDQPFGLGAVFVQEGGGVFQTGGLKGLKVEKGKIFFEKVQNVVTGKHEPGIKVAEAFEKAKVLVNHEEIISVLKREGKARKPYSSAAGGVVSSSVRR